MYRKLIVSLFIAANFASSAVAADYLISKTPVSQRPQIAILGTPHLSNHNRDINNAQMDDVSTQRRQSEIRKLVGALATWRPTHIAVEWERQDQKGLDKRYADYREGNYSLGLDEIDQIGLRLAKQLGLPRLDAINNKDDPPGPPSNFDIEAGAKLAGEEHRLALLTDPSYANGIANELHSNTVLDFLRRMNSKQALADANRLYYDFSLLGPPENNLGANWVGYWHGRNLKILANLVRLDLKPSDRMLVIFGWGHSYLLNQYAEESHAFRVVRASSILGDASRSH